MCIPARSRTDIEEERERKRVCVWCVVCVYVREWEERIRRKGRRIKVIGNRWRIRKEWNEKSWWSMEESNFTSIRSEVERRKARAEWKWLFLKRIRDIWRLATSRCTMIRDASKTRFVCNWLGNNRIYPWTWTASRSRWRWKLQPLFLFLHLSSLSPALVLSVMQFGFEPVINLSLYRTGCF